MRGDHFPTMNMILICGAYVIFYGAISVVAFVSRPSKITSYAYAATSWSQNNIYAKEQYTTSTRANRHGSRATAVLNLSSDDDENDAEAAANAIGGDLVTALAKLDKKWELARKDGGSSKKIGEWTILDVKEEDATMPEIVYLLEPTSGAVPSCVIFFLGGAVLGQFPHISYSTFLRKLATKMNAAVVAIPYEVGLDHFGIAQRSVKRMQNALKECEDSRGYASQLPKYAIGHSLGAKLHSIGIAATGIGDELAGLGFVSYNNFGFAETISMARSFAKEMEVGGSFGPGNPAFDTLFDLAGMAVSAVGLEFTPSPMDMDKILRTKFDGDEEVLKKIRMFSFDDDDLDSTKRFLDCFEESAGVTQVSHLPGTHLTVSTVQYQYVMM